MLCKHVFGLLATAMMLVGACGCGEEGFTVGGAVAGLDGILVLQNAGSDDLTIASDGSFTFPTALADGSGYSVAVATPPTWQSCSVSNGEGTVDGADVTNISISCKSVLSVDAAPLSKVVTLTWGEIGAARYDVVLSSVRGFNADHYDTYADGARYENVTSPFEVTGLTNGNAYYFVVLAESAGNHTRSEEVGARPNVLELDTSADALATGGDGTVYIGGAFTQVGARTGHGVPLDLVSGCAAIPTYPIVDGDVYAAVSDNAGGWYIGGEFATVGTEARQNLAHVLVDGTVDPDWNPGADQLVTALALGDATVYAGGKFTTVGGESHIYLAAISTQGTVLDWNPYPNPSNGVRVLTVSGTSVYAGGSFTTMGGQPRNNLAAMSADGTLQPWNPNANGSVAALAVSGTTVYAGGYFTSVGAESRNHLAAISTDGTLQPWTPDANGWVHALAKSGTTMCALTWVDNVSGTDRYSLLLLDATTGAPVD